jgi:aquaporin Z
MDKVSTASQPSEVKQDRPLRGKPFPHDKLHPRMYAAELVGTALLVFVGLSLVIALWGRNAPLAGLPIQPGPRRFLNGFLFGSVGAAIAFSTIGKMSGAHINPAMTFAFWLEGKIQWRDAGCYVLAQLAGGALGAAALVASWKAIGASANWGASLPASSVPAWLPVAGEVVCTFLLVLLIFACAAHKTTQPFTPLVNPPLFAVLTWLEAPLSGASANPARFVRAGTGRLAVAGLVGILGRPRSGGRACHRFSAIGRARLASTARGAAVPFRPSRRHRPD